MHVSIYVLMLSFLFIWPIYLELIQTGEVQKENLVEFLQDVEWHSRCETLHNVLPNTKTEHPSTEEIIPEQQH